MLAHVEMIKNQMFKLNLKIKTLSLRHEEKVEDEEVRNTSKALEA